MLLSVQREEVSETKKRSRRKHQLLIPVFRGSEIYNLLPLASTLKETRQVTILGVVRVETGHSLSEAADEARELRTLLRREFDVDDVRVGPRIIVSYNPHYDLAAYVTDQNVDLILLPWLDGMLVDPNPLNAVLTHVPCNVVVFRDQPAPPEGDILVLLRAGPDSDLALRLGLSLARWEERRIQTLRLTGWTDGEEDLWVEGLEQVLDYLPHVEDAVLLADDPIEAILEQATGYHTTVVGATGQPGTPEATFDELTQALLDRAPTRVLVARAKPYSTPTLPGELLGLEAISILVDKWFAENTFHADEFADLHRLLERKQQRGLTISLALPALNEEKTVGKVIWTIKSALHDEIPLLDEIVLIDSNSTDLTREIARDLGVPVYIHQDILPQYGARHGKGEALWKSLYVTHGDIVLWIDTDIVNIHPRFIYGLIGPLLSMPNLMFIKGFYLRPIRVGDTIQAGGGGRVTELTARPMLNLFYPALSGLIQPLSGEYGGRRSALEKLPFSSGYGVETGLLIDTLETFGLRAIGQVDLIERIHHNQQLTALSKMSFAIIQTVMRKLNRRYGFQIPRDINRSMKIIRHEKGHFFLEVEEIAERERPPIATLPEYAARHKRPVIG